MAPTETACQRTTAVLDGSALCWLDQQLMKNTVTLEIAGTRFRLVADADDQHLHELAHVVNERVAQLHAGSRTASPAQLLAMTALGLADDLRNAETRLKHMEELTRSTVQQAIARIDAHLGAGQTEPPVPE